MMDGIWQIVEMRGPSVVSLLLVGFLFYLNIILRGQMKRLNKDLEEAEKNLHNRIEKTLEKSSKTIMDSNEKIVQLRIEVGKLTEVMKGMSKSLDEVKLQLRDKKN